MSGTPRTIAIATSVPLWTIHYASELELAAEHLARGDEVHFLTCRGGLAGCTANPTKDLLACIFCRSVQRRGIKAVGIPASRVHVIPKVEVANSLPATSVDELRDLDAGRSEAGRATVSSLVSHVRDPEPDLTMHDRLARQLLASAQLVFNWTHERLAHIDVDRAYVFNGRYVNALPAVTAARDLGIPIIAHERNWNDTGFITRESGSVHSLDEFARLLVDANERVAGSARARSQSVQWFEGRRFPLGTDPIQTFTKDQHSDRLPPEFDQSAHNVAIFVSSEDEFVALAEWKHLFDATQEGTIASIVSHPGIDPAVEFWVRVHPNLRGLDNAQTARIELLSSPQRHNTHVIPSDSEIDSYALMEAADLVVTFGSTVGAEAIYWGTPVLLLGRALYETMDEIVVPASIAEAVQIINKGLPDPNRNAALGFGSLVTEIGHRFVHFRDGDGSNPPTFNGRSLRPSFPILATLKIAHTARRFARRVLRRYSGRSRKADRTSRNEAR